MSQRLEEARQGPVIVAALRLAAGGPAQAWVAWAVMALASVGLRLAADPLGLPTDSEQAFTPGYWIYEAGANLLAAVGTAFGLHAILRGRAPDPRRPGVLAFIGLMFLMEMYWSATSVLLFVPADSTLALIGKMAAWAAAVGVAGLLFARLLLWPMGFLIGEAGLTPRRSWKRMRGWTLHYLGAWLGIFMAALVIALGVLFAIERAAGDSDTLLGDAVDRIWTMAMMAVFTALSAVAYQRRAAIEALADVFD